jgi:RND family efflux transporter MFP subunit
MIDDLRDSGENMMRRTFAVVCLVSLLLVSFAYAQGNKHVGPAPAAVAVSEVKSGTLSPDVEFVGTVFYPEVSNVASETTGRIESVHFEDGQRLKKGQPLVTINSELLEKTLQGTMAAHEGVLAELEKARTDFTRIESLYRKQVVPAQLYDENRFKVQGLEKKAASLMAEVERLKIELERKVVRSPFDGVVIKRLVDRGEWLQTGSAVATIARDDRVDVVVEIPETVAQVIRVGMDVKVTAAGKETRGKVFALIPQGDIPTRTFPIKVRMNNTLSLVEGMEARVSLPTRERKRSLLVSRDAVIAPFGQPVVFVVIDSKAKMIPVKVIGYQGAMAGIEGNGLSEGTKVVVKGNERLFDGQPVTIFSRGG